MKTRLKLSCLIGWVNVFCILFLVGLTGCKTASRNVEAEALKYATPVKMAAQTPPAPKTEGSLWRQDAPLNDIFSSAKARNVGDIITVRIVESASATNKADTSTERKSAMSAGISNFFNLESKFPSTRPDFNPFARVEADFGNTFDGAGETTRSGDLTAIISARVIGLTASGNLVIAGSRGITINNEEQMLNMSGIVRPKDISAENEVLSSYISDAKIVYTGVGVLDDRQKPGWLTRTFDKAWPF
ncbi:MAG: flagellar basal body L-ring protein FlgH [Desulfobacterales bacterium]|nr:flagellar basal body L-ring protein FlgH [Desulfobacterales bacterium]